VRATSASGLRVAVTGPTGEVGAAFVRALDRADGVERVVGMARSPFDPETAGLKKLEYVQGDILDRSSVDALVKDVDVVVHLAFLVFGSPEGTRGVNLEGTRNVFEAALQSSVKRLVYTSSVAAYGFHEDNPELLTEDVPARGSPENYYSQQKAEIEVMLEKLARELPDTDVYVFRPCIVAGPNALALIENIPYVKLAEKLPGRVRKIVGGLPVLRPVIPDPGVPFQLVHEDDVAQALVAAVLGAGEPATYNLAAEGEVTLSDLAHALGWYAIPIPELTIDAAAEIVSRMPYLPATASWVTALRVPVLMDTIRARSKLGWNPNHDALETLAQTIHSARQRGLLAWQEKRPR
jgi:UDP-glucose 4-epimerase